MVSNARVMAEQAKLALNDAYVAAHGPSNPIRQSITPESVFSHPGLIREALEAPNAEVDTINEGILQVSAPMTPVGGSALLDSEKNTAEVQVRAPKGTELTDEQKDASKGVKAQDVAPPVEPTPEAPVVEKQTVNIAADKVQVMTKPAPKN